MEARPGTAQKISNTGGYLQNEYILSSNGVAPINDPEIAVYVAIDSPVGTNNYGGIIHCWRKRWTCKLGGKMEYLVMLVIILVVIAYILDGRNKK